MQSATYPVRPSPGSRGSQLMTNTAQLPSIVAAKRVRSASLRSDRPGSRGVSSSLSRQSDVPVESVMTMNKEAMTILQEGDIASSHKKLTEALLVAEAGARRCGSNTSNRLMSAKEREEQREAWLIAFAATLSNLGCVRRRANELQDALLYLEDARKVEQNIFGKPSCSTMVNLSAVLLGLGKANEALAIAHDCATASESGDPMLHVIALHNYGVTLSNHATAEVRQRAVPVLMRALREAESHFGIAHPTTILIRERCGMLTAHPSSAEDRATVPVHAPSHKSSSSSLHSMRNAPQSTQLRYPSQTQLPLQEERQLQKQQRQKQKQQQQPYKKQLPPQQQLEEQRLIALRPLPPLVSNAQQRAKEALQALDYGAPLVPLRATSCKASADTAALIAAERPRPPLAPIASETTHSEGNDKETAQVAVPRADLLSRGSSNCPASLHAKSVASVSLPSRSSSDAPVPPIGVVFESIGWETAGGSKGASQSECIEPGQAPPPQTTHNLPKDKAIDLSSEDKPTNGKAVQPTNESAVQPTNGKAVQPTNESAVQPTNGKAVQPTNESAVQPTNESTKQPTNESAVQPTNESTKQPTNESAVQPTNESTKQPTNESAVQPTNESTKQPTNESAVQPTNRIAKPSQPRPVWAGEFIDLRDRRPSEEPSFFRFFHKLPPSSTAHTLPAPLVDPKPSGGPSLATITGSSLTASALDTAEAADADADADADAAEAEAFGPEAIALRTHKAFERIFGESPAARREQRLRAESAEEFALRAERRARAEEAARQKYFEETFAAITARTRDRAARAIQYVWLYWWNTVGRRRRELRQLREADRQRRERTRLALLEHERLVNEAQQRKAESAAAAAAQKRQSDSTPHSVVRCARKWLLRTAAVRAAARGLLTGPARREAEWTRCIAIVQSVWRGRVARAAVALQKAARQRETAARAAQEAQMCAALVLARAWRSAAARAVLREKYNAHFGPVATRLQQWARAAMERRKALGIDRVSRLRRENAARRIQRQWRRRAALLAYYMLQLREKLNACRSAEAKAAFLLQRCGRGALERNRIAAHDAQVRRIQQAQSYVRGELVVYNKEGPMECHAKGKAKGPVAHYVPTPAAEVAAIRERERELCHIELFVEPVAQRTRAEWADALRLRPFDVRLRRANEDLLCTLELCTARRERAARRIQREFRNWRRIRDAEFRDNTLLLISRGRYQEDELAKKVDHIRFRREFAGGQKLFGDQTAPMRAEVEIVRAELEEVEPLVRSHVPWEEIRCPHERYDTEMALRRDEELLEKNKREEEIACAREETMRRAMEGLARSSSNKFCL